MTPKRCMRFAAALLTFALGACGDDPSSPSDASPGGYVGRATCAPCHEAADKAFAGSDHDLAMDVATETTVLGDFSGVTFEHHGVTSRFFRRDGKFVVTTEGPDGAPADFEVAYVFGVRPLQQYLVAFPGGRYQTLPLCWDVRPKDAGGQRWFHIYGDERIPAGDLLHWTRGAQNWNHMCAECHSTGLEKRWNGKLEAYETAWTEIDVSCEACHGPGTAHVAWANDRKAGKPARDYGDLGDPMGLLVRLRDRGPESWVIDPATGTAVRSRPSGEDREVETCARCHSRRGLIEERYVHGKPLLDTHLPSLLDEGVYHADGQILEEDYEYGSFLQSRMYRRGVSCRDCHDPHTLRVREEGNALCAKCHEPPRFDAKSHHFHEMGTDGAACVKCHMPAKTYMGVDVRLDHSLRVPRPDVTLRIGTPNSCNASGCHSDKDAAWSQSAVEKWYPEGRWRKPHFGDAIDAGRRALPGAVAKLTAVIADPDTPGIVRATATDLLVRQAGADSERVLGAAARDADPLVRVAAARAVRGLPLPSRVPLVALLAADSVRAVRIEAGRSSVGIPDAVFGPDGAKQVAAALAEYVRAQTINGDRPEAHLNLSSVAIERKDLARAETEARAALRLEPAFGGAYLNLADILRMRADEKGSVQVLRDGLRVAPDDATLHHALGLALVRAGKRTEAMAELARASQLAPENSRFVIAHALALNDGGDRDAALAILGEAHLGHPGDADLLMMLVSLHRDAGHTVQALKFAEALAALVPGNPQIADLVRSLK